MWGYLVIGYLLVGLGVYLGLAVVDEGYLEIDLVSKLLIATPLVSVAWPLMLVIAYYLINDMETL